MPELDLARLVGSTHSRRAQIAPSTVDDEARTIQVVWTTGATVRRHDWVDGVFDEALQVSPQSVRMGRLNNGANLLDSHRAFGIDGIVGVVERAWLAGGEGRAVVRFSARAAVDPVWQDVRAGIIRNVSVGYRIHKAERVERKDSTIPLVRCTDWEPLELSLVSVPADAGATTRANPRSTTMDDHSNTAELVAEPLAPPAGLQPAGGAAAERERISRITRAGKFCRIGDDVVQRFVSEGTGADVACRAILEAAAARDEADAIAGAGSRIYGGHDGSDPEFRFRQASDVLAHRLSGGRIALPDSAAPVRGMTLQELHRYAGDQRQRQHGGSWLSRGGWGEHTTSDFPILLLESAANRSLLDAFQVAASPLRQVARTIQVDDFRQITRARRGEAAKLLEIDEAGEVQSSTIGEEHEVYSIKTYARNFILSRKAIVNDDLAAFSDFLADMGRAAAITEAGVLVSLLTTGGNGVTLADGTVLFHANHGNLAGSAAALDVAPLGLARAAMRLQQSPTNAEPLNLVPRYLIVPAALEVVADQVVAQITAATVATVNPFSGRLEVLVEPRLDAHSTTAWYLVSDPAGLPFLEIATLNGSRPMATAGAPELRTFEDPDTMGVMMRAVHDFAAFPVNFRAGYKNAGAGGG